MGRLHEPCSRRATLTSGALCARMRAQVVQGDTPFVNAGLFYARPGRASQLMLDEMVEPKSLEPQPRPPHQLSLVS